MNRLYLMSTILIGIAACAISEPEVAAPAANIEKPAAIETPSPAKGDIEIAEVPQVPKAPGSPPVMADQQEIICHSERRTGSHRVTRVCRSRAEIERTEAEAKDSFKEMLEIQRTQGEY